ncbi:MAG: undecaprenyldiphospho-muramoylpentapeptide beta-N-acetylglucosaminyltransferase [Patescibacteria group bacterium]|nr:undecaprenyldiphospho-muramoylpentapeptide beta-N-acetylglucosaminyltransferase [Patescibacteria group bacterium]
MKILLTGGGTGGHLMPLLAVVSELKKLGKEQEASKLEFLLLSPDSEFNKSISDAGIQIKIIKAGKLRRYFSWENFVDIFKIPVGIIQSLYHLSKFKPNLVFSKGGFASIPPIVAAWILRIPIITHESDLIPGLANKIIARFSSKILISFSATEKYFNKSKVTLTGNPVRSDISEGNSENAFKFFELSFSVPIILIFGGSQGAQKINEMILEILPELTKKYQVIHQCGTKNYDKIKSAVSDLKPEDLEKYRLYPYLDKEMKDAYAIADIVIARAGANSISEIAVLNKPNILIPLSTSASNHQFKNAEFFVEKDASLMIDETVSNSDDLLDCIFKILADENLQNKMKKSLQSLSSQNSARKIAEEIMNVAQ